MIKRKDGRWQEQVKLEGMDKPKYFYGRTQAEVRRKMAEWKGEKKAGMLLADAVDKWQAWHETQVSPSSVRAYDPPVADIKDWFRGKRLAEVRADEVDAFLRGLAARGFAKRTVEVRRDCLNMTYNYAILQRWCETNPCAPVSLPKGLKKTRREPPSEEVLRAVESGEKVGIGLFAYLLLYTGLRRGELLGLRWDDVDLEAGVIHVRRSVYFVGQEPRLKLPKSEAGEREVMILDKLRPILEKGGKGYLFGGISPLTRGQFEKGWRDWKKEHGISVSPHQFRHAFATMLYEAGVADGDAMEILGHASISVTRDVYTHIRSQRRESTVRRMNQYLESCQDSVEDGKVVDIKGKK